MGFPPDAWLATMASIAQEAATPLDPALELTIRQVVEQPDGSTLIHRIVVASGRVALEVGDGPSSVSLRTDATTAAALAAGDLSIEAAFVAGKVHIDGDLESLVKAQPALAALGDMFAVARASAQTSNERPDRQ